MEQGDEAVISTNDEALNCRIDMDASGILVDPFVKLFRPYVNGDPVSPLIRRGTFIRTRIIDQAIEDIATQPVQIISLGAGYDTRWQRSFVNNPSIAKYIEVDFPLVMAKKKEILGKFYTETSRYSSISCDLNKVFLQDGESVFRGKIEEMIEKDEPLIIIAECCLMYLHNETTLKLLKYLSSLTANVAHTVIYDPLYMQDAFSTMMLDNFLQRGIRLEPITNNGLTGLKDIYKEAGWTINRIETMHEAENSLIDSDRNTLTKLLALDEYEEWHLVSNHYHFAILTSQVDFISNK